MMRELTIFSFLAILIFWTFNSASHAQSFDGITIIDLSISDKAGKQAILGHAGQPRYLVTFVTAQGTYAAIGPDERGPHGRNCVAWAQPGSYTGDSITFGLPASDQSMKLVHPSICLPFTLRFEGPGTVRVETTNNSKNTQTVRYSRKRRVIAQIPLIAFDWSLPVFSRYNIKRVRLGPFPALRAELGENADVNLSELGLSRFGKTKIFRVTMHDPSDRSNSTTVNGRVVAAEVMGWPWDVLYGASYFRRLPQRSLTEVFDQSIFERYGEPSLKTKHDKTSGKRYYYWFFDLDGQQLRIDDAAPSNCLTTWEHWKSAGSLMEIDTDIGPWGCSLTMILTHNGGHGMVSQYSTEITSGYTMALNHFLGRLEEVRTMREKIQEAQSREPKL
jgi:hypothetical protein